MKSEKRFLEKQIRKCHKARAKHDKSLGRAGEEVEMWHRQFAYWLFTSFPHYNNREGAHRDDRPEKYRRKDWSWHLRYMKGRRLGYEIDID